MAAGGAVARELEEASSPPQSKIRKIELQAALSSKSEPVQEKKLAYLRDTELWDLLPTEANKRLKEEEPLPEGSAAPFVREMFNELQKPLDPQIKEQILVREIKLFLETEGEGDHAKNFHSTTHFQKLPDHLQTRFHNKDWHFNASNDVGGLDDYQLLCLGPRDKVDNPITDFCNKIGNTCRSDFRFLGFCRFTFTNLLLDDTEYVGFERAIKIKNWYEGRMKSLIIPWVLNVWTTYITEARKYDEQIELHCELWKKVVDEKNEFSEALYESIRSKLDPRTAFDFSSVIEYVQQRLSEQTWKKPIFLIDEYFEKSRSVRRLDKGYALYLKEKIIKARQLGIIKKEDEDKFAIAGETLKELEDTNLYLWEKESWFRHECITRWI